MLHALGLNIAKLFRFYEKGYLTKMWTPPKNTKPETFKKPNVKRLVKRGEKINKNVHKNDK